MENEKINECLYSRSKFTKELFKKPKSLSKFLIYEEFIADYGIFANKDGSLGAIYEVDLIEHEPLSGDQIIDSVKGTKPLFQVPENCVIQVIHEQRNIESTDKVWNDALAAYPESNQISDTILEERIKEYKKLCNSSSEYAPKERKTFLTIKYFPLKKNRSFYQSLICKDSEFLLNEVKSFSSDVKEFNEILKNFEENIKLGVNRINADSLISVLRKFFNPNDKFNNAYSKYNPNCSISDQVIYNSPKLNYGGIERNGIKTQTISLKNCPQFSLPGGMANFLKLDFPYKICLNFSLPEKMKVKRGLKLKSFFLERTPSPEARKLKDDLDMVQEKLAHGDRCLQMTFTILVEGSGQEELDSRTRKVLGLFINDLECDAIIDRDIGLGLCLNTLPLMYSPESDFSTQRSVKILQSDAQNFLPIFDSYRGTNKNDPMQLFLSRENNPVSFSIIDKSRSSNHSCVVADTGSGKSSLVCDIVQAYKRQYPDPIIFYVEKRASSKTLCKLFDGESTTFQIGEKIHFTPFRGKFDDSKVNYLTLFITTAVRLSNPSFVVESEHSTIVQEALKVAYRKKIQDVSISYEDGHLVENDEVGSTTLTMDDVASAIGTLHDDKSFSSLTDQIDELLHKLRDYFGDGKYADFFRGSNQTEKSEKTFFVYDLDGLESDPILQALVTLSIFEEIRRVISLPENEGRTGIIVFEEMGQLGKNNPTAARYIVDFAETIRKLGYWLISIAPRPQNFFETDAGRAAWGAADNYFFMEMKPDSVKYIRENSEILNDVNEKIVNSIKTIKGKHADVFFTNKDNSKSGAFRFLRTELDRWLIPNTEDKKTLDEVFADNNFDAAKTLKDLLEPEQSKMKEVG